MVFILCNKTLHISKLNKVYFEDLINTLSLASPQNWDKTLSCPVLPTFVVFRSPVYPRVGIPRQLFHLNHVENTQCML